MTRTSLRLVAPVLAMFLMLTTTALAAPERATTSAKLNMSALQPGHDAIVAVIYDVKPGFHAQSHHPLDKNLTAFKIEMDENPALSFGTPIYPPGIDEDFPALGKLNVYTGQIVVFVPVKMKADAQLGATKITGSVTSQICDNKACYLPTSPQISIDTTIVAAGQAVTPTDPELFAKMSTQATSTTTWGEYLVKFGTALLVGVIFNVMPCVLPVVPLKILGFYEVAKHSRAKSIALGAVFSAGLIASFGVLAILIVALQWLDWGELFTKPSFIAAIVAILLIMAASTFGLFTVQLPGALYSVTPRHDTYVGNFLFGILTAALSTPCTFGLFVGLLTWALSQPKIVGVTLIMTVGAGMALPYFILSALPELARRFPRTGPWSELVKQLMAFLLLGAAVYFARPFIQKFLDDRAMWWAIFAVIAAAGIFLIVKSAKFSKRFMPRAIAIAVAVLMIAPSLYAARMLTYQPYDWKPYSTTTLADAQSQDRVIVVDFTATWCGNCQYLEAFVINKSAVVDAVKSAKVLMIKGDVTDKGAPARPLLNELNPVGAIPLTVVYGPGIDEPIQLTGIYSAEDLINAIARAGKK